MTSERVRHYFGDLPVDSVVLMEIEGQLYAVHNITNPIMGTVVLVAGPAVSPNESEEAK